MHRREIVLGALCGAMLLLAFVTGGAQTAPLSREAAMKGLKFREIGPAIMGGRTDDIAVVEGNSQIVYAGLAGGGVWKTDNNFTTLKPIFENEAVSTIGSIAVAASDPAIVWVGTGEANNRQSSSWGNGVYRSLDAGQSWQHMGLDDTQHIGRMAIHPRNPNIVFVAAQGHLWGPNHERGVFRTTDGGKTWSQVLYIDDDTGANDVQIDRESPDTIYASAYTRRRTPAGYNGGGPKGGLYKSIDGGTTWTKLAGGLPATGDVGRIGISIYRKNTNIVYCVFEHQQQGGVYRSEDKGATWTRMSATNPRPSYFSLIRVDPNNEQRVWLGGVNLFFSDDGGRNFHQATTNSQPGVYPTEHEDFHGFWIDPANSGHMISGNDGGLMTTYDGGRTWALHQQAALGQFYKISYDMKRPYNICGGTQDNGSWCGPSAAPLERGMTNEEWMRIGGGDGMYAFIDPNDPDTVYTESQDGNVSRRDLKTGQARNIRPREADEKAARYRFNWTSPFLLSNFDSKIVYMGGNYVFKSEDRGDSWKRVSPDLTTGADREQTPILGKKPGRDMLSRHDGVQSFTNITTLAESGVRPGVVWAGTDDGNLQVTRDGETWKNVVTSIPGLPKGTSVARVIASKTGEGTAFAAFDGHRTNDFTPYLYMTTDFGEHWTDIAKGLPRNNGSLHVVLEHPRNPNLLFAGTEYGLFVSFNRGQNWQELKNNLPRVPIYDILIHPRDNDLILGTHGRSIWILDDITPLEQMTDPVVNSELTLFDVRPGVEWRLSDHRTFTGHAMYVAQNQPAGAIVNYYLKSKPAERNAVKVEILDRAGAVIRTVANAPAEAGLNRVIWDLRTDAPGPVVPAGRGGAALVLAAAGLPDEVTGAGGGGRGGPLRGVLAEPGEYSVRVSAAGAQSTKKVVVEDDLRVRISPAERLERRKVITELFGYSKQAEDFQRRFTAVRTALIAMQESWKLPNAMPVPDNVKKAAADLTAKLDAIQRTAPPNDGGAGPAIEYIPAPVSQRIRQLMNGLDSFVAPVTKDQVALAGELGKELTETAAKLGPVLSVDVPALNKLMATAGVPFLYLPPAR